ncbi:MAG: HutD family protein [Fretibacterium sp.]|nr:HutD family protein [Fretibacterium sp.]
MRHLTAKDFQVSAWSGGKTVQIAIAPEGAAYADRDFLWRVSSATVELEESDFTALPDYERWIMPLSGEMRLSHDGGAPVSLAIYEAHRFDGADKTHSWGRCTDFNLMLRKGRCQGRILALWQDAELEEARWVLYCARRAVAVNEIVLGEGEALCLDGEARIRFSAPGCLAAAEVWELRQS